MHHSGPKNTDCREMNRPYDVRFISPARGVSVLKFFQQELSASAKNKKRFQKNGLNGCIVGL